MANFVCQFIMAHFIFAGLFVLGVIAPMWFLGMIWRERLTHGWRWVNKDSRVMYVDAIKTVASASAIAASLVSTVTSTASRGATSNILSTSVKVAVVALILSVVASIFAILALSRGYERARSRFIENPRSKGADLDQGELSDAELGWILGPAWAGFLLGFLLVGHIVFEH
jgi:hypothetical protein